MKSRLLSFIVNELKQESSDTVSVILSPLENYNLSFLPGQFLTLYFTEDGKEVSRCFSIFTSPNELPIIGLAIKVIPGGFISKHLANLSVGSVVRALPPVGTFNYELKHDSNTKSIFLIGAGSGITPLISIAKYALYASNSIDVKLLYGSKSYDSILLRNRIELLQTQYGSRFTVEHFLSRETKVGHENRRINSSDVEKVLKTIPKDKWDRIIFYFCGPKELTENLVAHLTSLGIDSSQLKREQYTFGIESTEITGRHTEPKDITIISHGRTEKIRVEAGDNILQTALDEDILIPYSCQMGVCKSCRGKLLAGKLSMEEQRCLSEEEIKEGYFISCVSYPLTDDVIVNFDDPSL